MQGNDNTLVFGALNLTAVNADPDPLVVDPFVNGQVDQIHIHSRAIDFGDESQARTR